MGEADVTLSQPDEKPPDPGLLPGDDSVVWSHEVEVCLFHAMIGHKPVGKQAASGPERLKLGGADLPRPLSGAAMFTVTSRSLKKKIQEMPKYSDALLQ